ncbi:HAMP domain-containing protein [Streptomyces sp. NPDC059649]|uniref:HAMP domain-containing protein n=1 Tax=Streptomyces sp. NPDC059649 TaxID=3346895 RepID=UPI0036A825C3
MLLLAVSGITALTVGRSSDSAVSQAVIESQQLMAADAAGSLSSSLEQSSHHLRDATALLGLGAAHSPDAALRGLSHSHGTWRGLAAVDPTSGKLLAARGENVPLSRLPQRGGADALQPRLVTLDSGQPRLLSFALLDAAGGKRQLLIASGSLRLPEQKAGRTTFVMDSGGRILAAAGDRAEDSALRKLAGRSGQAEGGANGSRTERRDSAHHDVVGYAPVPAGPDGQDFGLTLATSIRVPEGTAVAGDRFLGLGAAAALLAICLAVTWVLRRWVQRPVLRLHVAARRLARGDLQDPVPAYGSGEAARVSRSLECLRLQLAGASGCDDALKAPSRRRTMRNATLCCAALVTAWSCALPLITLGEGRVPVPAPVVHNQQERTADASDRVRRILGEGVAGLSAVARLTGGTPQQIGKALDTALPRHSTWRSLYLVDRAGNVPEYAGEAPYDMDHKSLLAKVKSGTPALVQLNHDGKVPSSAAVVPVGAGGGQALVAEFRPEALSGVLTRPGIGRAWLVDADDKIIGSNESFFAFDPLPGEDPADGPALTAAAEVRGAHTVEGLGWRVVTRKPMSRLPLASYETRRQTELAALLAFSVAVLCLGWLHLTVLRPLHALERTAAALAAGDTSTVLYPRHHDEVGSIVRSLELVRQQLAAAQADAGASRVAASPRS